MPKLPVLSGKELIRTLEKDGFRIVRQKGSHVSLQKGIRKTVVSLHNELAKGTLLGILKQLLPRHLAVGTCQFTAF